MSCNICEHHYKNQICPPEKKFQDYSSFCTMYIPQYLLSLRSISSAGPPTQPHSTQELPIQAQQDSLSNKNFFNIYIYFIRASIAIQSENFMKIMNLGLLFSNINVLNVLIIVHILGM